MLWWSLLAILRTGLIYTWLFFKPILGWFLIIVGLIGMPMPIVNGLIFLVIGLALVGHRNRTIRWARVQIKLFLAYWATREHPLLRTSGRLARRSAQQISRQHRRLRWWMMARREQRLLKKQAVAAAKHTPSAECSAPSAD